jgi:hypothetical protein
MEVVATAMNTSEHMDFFRRISKRVQIKDKPFTIVSFRHGHKDEN